MHRHEVHLPTTCVCEVEVTPGYRHRARLALYATAEAVPPRRRTVECYVTSVRNESLERARLREARDCHAYRVLEHHDRT